jgi:hypothetical protein
MNTATHRATEYTVYPAGFDQVDHHEKHDWTLRVQDTGRGWRVARGTRVMAVDGTWTLGEPNPSGRGEDHFARYRFANLDAALAAAKTALATITVAGMTFEQYATWVAERGWERP